MSEGRWGWSYDIVGLLHLLRDELLARQLLLLEILQVLQAPNLERESAQSIPI